MNPLLSVNPKRVSIINSQNNVASTDCNDVIPLIDDYLSKSKNDAEKRNSNPVSQHRIPRFLLRDFEGPADGHDKRLRVVQYSIRGNGEIAINDLSNGTSKNFSTKDDFYSIDEFYEQYEALRVFGANDKYRIEKLFSILEKNAAPMLKLRQTGDFYRSSTYANPYLYPNQLMSEQYKVSSSSALDSTTGRRVALSTFFAMQYLRSNLMYRTFADNIVMIAEEAEKVYGKFQAKNFPDFVEYMLPIMTWNFYSRSWRWVYSSYDGMMPEGTSILPLFANDINNASLGEENALIMPLGRNATIYFQEPDSFYNGHDGVFKSNSLGLSAWSNQKVLIALNYDMSATPNGHIEKACICMHPNTKMDHIFKTGREADEKLKKELDSIKKAKTASEKALSFLGTIPRKERALNYYF